MDIDIPEMGSVAISTKTPLELAKQQSENKIVPNDDSATESSDDNDVSTEQIGQTKPSREADRRAISIPAQRTISPAPPQIQAKVKKDDSSLDDQSVSPANRPSPSKKARAAIAASSDDSEDEQQQRLKSGIGAKRGTRQPVKRGGKRF